MVVPCFCFKSDSISTHLHKDPNINHTQFPSYLGGDKWRRKIGTTLKQPGLRDLIKSREIDETGFLSLIFNDSICHFAC